MIYDNRKTDFTREELKGIIDSFFESKPEPGGDSYVDTHWWWGCDAYLVILSEYDL